LAVIIFGGYFGYQKLAKNKSTTQYVTAAVERGTLITSVSGTGQVSSLNQVDIKSKASADITYLNMQQGQEVKKGALLVKLDTTDIQKTIDDAQTALQQAETALEKLNGTTTSSGTLRGEKEKAADNLQQAYEDGFNTISSAFLDLPNVMSGLYGIFFSNDFSANQSNIYYYGSAINAYDERGTVYENDAYNKYLAARTAYDKNIQDYKLTSRTSDNNTIDTLISETYDTMKKISDAIKSMNNLIQFYQDTLTKRGLSVATVSTTHLTNLNTYTGKINSYLTSLLSATESIQSDKETLVQADFDIANQEIQVKQAQDTLNDAQAKLADYSIIAPFDGVLAAVNVKNGDSISANTAVATIITKQNIAEITLNEVDAANIKVGQKVTLTFDAIDGLNIAGEVSELDNIGTVSQGVVTYGVKITFDTQDDRVKPGMSVSAAIITEAKQNVLMVSNSAIKSNGTTKYVQILSGNSPQNQTIETGLSNDTMTEITSGLKEGDSVIVRTVSSTAKTQTQTNSSIRIPGITGGGAGR
jgi:HlyD family secretion protein